jgi:hypothetical protein
MEVLYGYLPKTPSHTTLRKVRGYVGGFTGQRRKTITKKILLVSGPVKGEIAENWFLKKARFLMLI